MYGDPPVGVQAEAVSLLLELAAADDVAGLVRHANSSPDLRFSSAGGFWYGRSCSPSRHLSVEIRTPLMIAAGFGNATTVSFLLSSGAVSAAAASPSDGATALHLAAASGALSSPETISLLLAAGADIDALDASGNRPGDLIPRYVLPAAAEKPLRELLKSPATSPSSSPKKFPSSQEISTVVGTPPGKKEYPLDATLPDIKSGIYSTDEFRMYAFKVKPCSRAYSHDWTECPFVHPGENARRRDPRKYAYTCVPCPEFRKGSCRKGDSCEYAHGVFESWLHPAQYRTRLCKDEVGCKRRICFFAHKPEELRSVNPSAVSIGSPRASNDLATAALLLLQQQQQQQPGSPVTASVGNRLKVPAASSLGITRELDFDLDMFGLQSPHQNWAKSVSSLPSPMAATSKSDYLDLLGGSMDTSTSLTASMLSQLQALSLNQSDAMFQSQLQSSQLDRSSPPMSSAFGRDLPPLPSLSAAPAAKAILNSRAAAFAKRSQSFRYSSLAPSPTPAMPTSGPSLLTDWSSPDGRLDWGVQGEELNKLRKSASFAIRSSGAGTISPPAAMETEEPDLSWVNSLVKETQPSPTSAGMNQLGRRLSHDGGKKPQFSQWGELLYKEEQMVA